MDVALGVAEGFAGGDADLFVHQIRAGDHFGYGMFNLKAGIHFDKGELLVLVEELQRAGVAVADFLQGLGDGFAERVALCCADRGRAGFFQQFWWRRCREQSRSPKCTTLPWLSARI